MSANSQNSNHGNAAGPGTQDQGEETLRLIARLPAPEGLEGRIKAALRTAPREGHVLPWPAPLKTGGAWMRTAAAAAIAFVIAGGGWGVYHQVAPLHPGSRVTLAPHGAAPGGFAGAGLMRTPQTLVGPVLTQPAQAHPLPAKNGKKTAVRGAAQSGQKKPAAQPSAQSGAQKPQ
jgi:hypothetical protein